MTWWEDFKKAFADGLANADRTTRADLVKALDSGATTPAEIQRDLDRRIAAIEDEDVRAAVIEDLAEIRAGLEGTLTASGYTGDLSGLTVLEVASLAGRRARFDLKGDATLPAGSAADAAAAAETGGGSWTFDETTGAFTIFDANGKFYDYIPGGQPGRPTDMVQGEVQAGSGRGGPRPVLPEDLVEVLRRQAADADGGTYSVTDEGDIVVHQPDGSDKIWEHDAIAQFGADLKAASGNPREIADIIDRAANDVGRGVVGAIGQVLGDFGWPGLGMNSGSGATPGAGGSTPGTSEGTGDASGGSKPSGPSSPDQPDPDPDDLDPVWPGVSGSGSSTTITPPTATADPEEPEEPEDPDEPEDPEDGDGGDAGPPGSEEGWARSTKRPPSDSTYVDADNDGIPDDEEDDDDAADDDDDDDDDDGGDGDDGDDGDEEADPPEPDAGYTPRPGDDQSWRNLTPEQFAALRERAAIKAGARGEQSDRTDAKATEFDPAFIQEAQERKEGLIGNPGPDEGDGGLVGGGSLTPPVTYPEDDTPGMTPPGHDRGAEDPMLHRPQGTLVPESSGGGGSGGRGDDTASILDPIEMVEAEINVAPPAGGGTYEIPDQVGYVEVNPGGGGSPGGGTSGDAASDDGTASALEPLEMVEGEINVAPPTGGGYEIPDQTGYIAVNPGGGGNPSGPTSDPSSDDGTASTVDPLEMVEAEINVSDDGLSLSTLGDRSDSSLDGSVSLPDAIELPRIDPDDDPPDR